MLADITWLELRPRRRSAIGYAAGMALYTFVVVALYPSFKNSTSLDNLSGSTAAALFGVTGPLTSPGGWLNGNIYSNFFPPLPHPSPGLTLWTVWYSPWLARMHAG